MLTKCSNCGAEFDHEAHSLTVTDPALDETVHTDEVVRAHCPACGQLVEVGA